MRERRRILLVGPVRPGGNVADWMASLSAMGYDVRPFDTLPYATGGTRLGRSLAARLAAGPRLGVLNADLRAAIGAAPFDLALVVKGTWLWPETVEALARAAATGTAVHLSIDAMFGDNGSRHFRAAVPLYDLHVTDKRFEADAYRAAGARGVEIIVQGYGARFAAADPSRALARTDACFVGHRQRHYAGRLAAVAGLGVDLGVWGPGWPVLARRRAWAARAVRGGPLFGPAYPDTMAAARIGLGLLSKRIAEEATTRSVEIPATGAMLLAERTARHLALFEEGVEAEFFDTDGEMVDKLRFYLAREAARRRVAAAGHARCRRDGYDMASRLRALMASLAPRLGVAAPG